MVTKEEIITKLQTLKDLIAQIPNEVFKPVAPAHLLKSKLKNRVDNVIELVNIGTPDSLNAAIFILTWRIARVLDSSKRFSWVTQPLPTILSLIDEIIDDIELLFTNTPPIAIIKIDGIDVGSYYTAPVNVELNFDGTSSWDEDGEVVAWQWDFGDGTPVVDAPAARHTFSIMGTFRVVLTVSDNGSPTESAVDWVEITVI